MSVDLGQSSELLIAALRYSAGSDVGRHREENQDCFGVVENDTCKTFIVADGMGGVQGGAVASKLAVQVLREHLIEHTTISENDIVAAVQEANHEILERGKQDLSLSGMGTTIVGLSFVGASMYIMSVGDSRAYRIRRGQIHQLTDDHTLVMELLRSGAITRDQADHHPISHMLTRSLGPTPDVKVDCWLCEDGPYKDDLYLLCTDGLYNMLTPEEILGILTSMSLDQAVKTLINKANGNGGTDNITAIIISVGEGYPTLDAGPGIEPVTQARPLKRSTYESSRPSNATTDPTPTTDTTLAPPASLLEKYGKFLTISLLFKLVGAFVIGVIVSPYIINGIRDLTKSVSAPHPLAARIAKLHISGRGYHNIGTRIAGMEEMARIVPLEIPNEVQQALSVKVELNSREKGELIKRHALLIERIKKLDQQIELLGRPAGQEVRDSLEQIKSVLDKQRTDESNLVSDIDSATRKFSVWVGRRKRLENTDPVDMASEVAISSATVKSKKEAFERDTWTYLKEVEVWRYNPTDKAAAQRVEQLARVRGQRLRELTQEVKSAIDSAVSISEQEITGLSRQRDEITTKIEELQHELDFHNLLLNAGPEARIKKLDTLNTEKEAAVGELGELGALLGK